jgi:polyhydroxyalkanoate synthesis repressor PhaR
MAGEDQTTAPTKRVSKRYSNRKLYDTTDSRYVTLQQIGEMVRRGDDVQIIDNKTKEDKTEVTLALILSEDLKNKPRSVPLATLRTLIQERGTRMLSTLREGPLGRLITSHEDDEAPPSDAEVAPVDDKPAEEKKAPDEKKKRMLGELVETSRQTLDQLQATLDERVKAVVPSSRPIRELRAELDALTRRVEAIERHLGLPPPNDGS